MNSRFAVLCTARRGTVLALIVTLVPWTQANAGQTWCLWQHLSPAGRDELYAQYKAGGMPSFKWTLPPLETQQLVNSCVTPGGDAGMIAIALGISMDEDRLGTRLGQRGFNTKDADHMWALAKPAIRGEAIRWIDVSMADHSKQPDASIYFVKLAHSGYPGLDPNSPDGADTLKLLALYFAELAMAEWAEAKF